MVAPLARPFDALLVEVEGTVQVPDFDVEPPETVQEAVTPSLVANLLGERQALLQHGKGCVVVALASQGEPVCEETIEKRRQKLVLPGDIEGLRREARCPHVLPFPILELSDTNKRAGLVEDVAT